jgi:hypothetical protein
VVFACICPTGIVGITVSRALQCLHSVLSPDIRDVVVHLGLNTLFEIWVTQVLFKSVLPKRMGIHDLKK